MGLNVTHLSPDLVQTVASVNSEAARALLKRHRPDVVVVNGTRIIDATTLRCIDVPFINMHTGITPRYRGVHGGYWALYKGEPEHCGVTVHQVDEGIDSGAVLYQATITPTAHDTCVSLPMLQLAAGIPLMLQAVEDALNGILRPRISDGPSAIWTHPTLGQYLGARLFRGIK